MVTPGGSPIPPLPSPPRPAGQLVRSRPSAPDHTFHANEDRSDTPPRRSCIIPIGPFVLAACSARPARGSVARVFQFCLLATLEHALQVIDVGLAQVFLGGNELFLLFLADVVKILVLQLRELREPAG